MVIKILGSGCPNCKKLEQNARTAAETLNLNATFEKVTAIDDIIDYGVMKTPGLVIDEVLKSTGKVLSVDEIIDILKA
jgi:small redox-active disulfide protein 2